MILLVLALALTLLAGNVAAAEIRVSDKIQTRKTIDEDGLDAFTFKLDDGDKAVWLVNVVEGDNIDVYLMEDEEYAKLKYGTGGTPMYLSSFSELDTDSASSSFKADVSSEIGDYVIIVVTHEEDNATATYDIDLKIERAPPPQGLLDRLCALGTLTCVVLLVIVIVVVLIVLAAYRRSKRGEEKGPEQKSEVTYVDSMMRPGFDIPVGPSIPPPPKKKKKKKGKKKKRKKKKKKKKKKAAEPEPVVVEEAFIDCPECGAEISAELESCPSCGVEFTYELECPVCGHSNPSDVSTCGGCEAEFE
jgi:hypothetical protein